jgi:two-component system response regulator GlrR
MAARVLIVDDDPDILKLTSVLLVLSGYEVAAAASGEQALEIQNRQPANLVISDAVMPGMKGPALLDSIGRAFPSTALILMSGYSLDELPRRASFLPKPFRPEQLIAAAEQALARAAQTREVVALECQRADELHRRSERILSASAASGAAQKDRIDERKGAASETTGPARAGRRARAGRG